MDIDTYDYKQVDLKQYLQAVNVGIFNDVFQPTFADDYKVIFGNTIPQTLDIVISLCYGDKPVTTKVSEMSADDFKQAVQGIIALNVDGWKRAAKTMVTDYDVVKPVIRETTRTETGDENETNNDVTTGSQKAFNDTEFSDDTKDTANNTRERKSNNTVTETVTGTGSRNISDTVEKEMQIRLDNWRKNIIFAIVREITKDIY